MLVSGFGHEKFWIAESVPCHLVVVVGSKVDGNESQPHDRSGVHCEADVLGFVEVLRYFSGFKCVESAEDDQRYVVNEGHHQGEGRHFAGEDGSKGVRMDLLHIRSLDDQPHDGAHQLHENDAWRGRG